MSHPSGLTRRTIVASLLSSLVAMIFGWRSPSAAAPASGQRSVGTPSPDIDYGAPTFYEYDANTSFGSCNERETTVKMLTFDAANRGTRVKWIDA